MEAEYVGVREYGQQNKGELATRNGATTGCYQSVLRTLEAEHSPVTAATLH